MHLCKYAEFQFFRYPICIQRPLYQNLVLFYQTPRLKGLKSLGRQKKLKMKNDPCRNSLPPGVNRFVEKGPLKPEKKQKGPQKPRTKKSYNEK